MNRFVKGAILSVMLCVLSTALWAQNSDTKITLKDGTHLIGNLCGTQGESHVKIYVAALQDTLSVLKADIKKISFLDGNTGVSDGLASEGQTTKISDKILHRTSMGWHLNKNNANMNAHMVNGAWLTDYLAVGAGIGIEDYSDIITAPVYLHTEIMLPKAKISPFVYGNAGYGFLVQKLNVENEFWVSRKDYGGLYYSFGFGYKFPIHQSAIVLKLGYQSQLTAQKYWVERWVWETRSVTTDLIEEERISRRFAISVGFEL